MATTTFTGYTLDTFKKWTGSGGGGGSWETSSIPVDLPTTTAVTLGRIVTSTLHTGDLIKIHASARVTNDCGYTVGVGWYVKGYEYTGPGITNPLFDVETLMGDNVTPNGQRHHMPLASALLWPVPADWDGKRVVLCLRADAHSTAWQDGDTLSVDQGYGQFWIEHWKPPVL